MRMPATAERSHRVESIDVVRGLVMILMALDHTRDFFGARVDPTNLSTTTVALFFTRWITHVCAPTFFLLTGTGAALSLEARSPRAVSKYLLLRGIWLIVLELTVIRCLGFQFNADYRVTLLVVIWALGWSMIALAGLIHLPTALLAAVGVIMIAGHNLLDGVRSSNPIWAILHGPGFVVRPPGPVVFAAYPLIPWIGVTALGCALGRIYTWAPERRRRFLLRVGIALPVSFVALRMLNVYGDPVRWKVQGSTTFTILSFLNATKYPPSLLFLLMTLGFTFLGLWVFDRGMPRILEPVKRVGQAPLFYFIVHLPLIHALAMVVALLRYGSAHWFWESPSLDRYPFTLPPGWGYSLPVVYLAWAIVVALMYYPTTWFARLKMRSRAPWLRYV